MSRISCFSRVMSILFAWVPTIAVNLFTTIRIVLAPVVLVSAVDQRWCEALVFLVISELTELLDGSLAGLLEARTAFGRKFDQVADVFMTSAAALGLIVATGGLLPWIVAGVLGAISLGINITLNVVPRWVPAFKSTYGYVLLNAFFPFSSVAVQLAILSAYIVKASLTMALPFLFIIMLAMVWVKRSRIDEWLEPVRQKRVTRHVD